MKTKAKNSETSWGLRQQGHVTWRVWQLTDPSAEELRSTKRFAYPAYDEGQEVEFWKAEEGEWCVASVSARLMKLKDIAQVVYAASPASANNLNPVMGVPLEALREPLKEDEICEVFSAKGSRWYPATIAGVERSEGKLSYYVMYQQGLEKRIPRQERHQPYPASWVRRRCVPGSTCEIYFGPAHGWVPGMVCVGEQKKWELQDRPTNPQQKTVLAYLWKSVSVRTRMSDSIFELPAYRLRPAGGGSVKALGSPPETPIPLECPQAPYDVYDWSHEALLRSPSHFGPRLGPQSEKTNECEVSAEESRSSGTTTRRSGPGLHPDTVGATPSTPSRPSRGMWPVEASEVQAATPTSPSTPSRTSGGMWPPEASKVRDDSEVDAQESPSSRTQRRSGPGLHPDRAGVQGRTNSRMWPSPGGEEAEVPQKTPTPTPKARAPLGTLV